jgi:spermidine/putrescine transport system substrate-binding protein
MWSRVKGDNLNTGIVLLIFAVFGLLLVWLVYKRIKEYKQRQRYRSRRRRRRW